MYIYQGFAEEVPRPAGYFDLMTCLNVIDRHNNPSALVKTLYDLLNLNGILVLSSPMEFKEAFTPDKERWVRDLNVLFSNSEWFSINEDNIPYQIRLSRRELVCYNSQVVIKQKKKQL